MDSKGVLVFYCCFNKEQQIQWLKWNKFMVLQFYRSGSVLTGLKSQGHQEQIPFWRLHGDMQYILFQIELLVLCTFLGSWPPPSPSGMVKNGGRVLLMFHFWLLIFCHLFSWPSWERYSSFKDKCDYFQTTGQSTLISPSQGLYPSSQLQTLFVV